MSNLVLFDRKLSLRLREQSGVLPWCVVVRGCSSYSKTWEAMRRWCLSEIGIQFKEWNVSFTRLNAFLFRTESTALKFYLRWNGAHVH